MTNLEKAAMRPVYILSKWIGYKEKSSPYNLYDKNASNDAISNSAQDYTMFAQYFDDLRKKKGIDFYGDNVNGGKAQGNQWCDMTVDWAQCMAWGPNMALKVLYSKPYKTTYAINSKGCKWSKSFYVAANAWIKGNESNGIPKVGDQIFFIVASQSTVDPNHTGIVSKVNNSTIEVIEGNASRSVMKKVYNRKASNIDGYGRPNYNLVKDQFDHMNYDANIDLANALLLSDSAAIAAVNKVMGQTITPVEEKKKEPETSKTVENKKYTLSDNQLKRIRENINKGIAQYNQAILDYNLGNTSKASLEAASREYNRLKDEYKTYADKVKEKITNYNVLESYINLLFDTVFPNVSELERKRNTGSTNWFSKFQNSYNEIISTFYKKINNLYLALANQIAKGAEYNSSYIKYTFVPLILSPLSTDQISLMFFWKVLFNGEEGPNERIYLEEYTNNYGVINYDEACYAAYNNLIDYYTNIITEKEEEINQYSIEQNFSSIIQNLLDILQADIYKLYAETFGLIEQKKVNDSIVYEKYGVAYNFGDNNNDYDNFYQKYKTSIFGSNLYLSKIKFDVIKEYIDKIIQNYINLDATRKSTMIDLYNALVSYENSFSTIKENAKKSGGLVVNWREIIYQMAKDYYNYANNPKYNFIQVLYQNNKNILQSDYSTGYETFYTDLLGFWRYLYYNPILENIDFSLEENTSYNYTYLDYSIETYWNKIMYTDPSSLIFWFDLTEGTGEINNYQINMIGDRLKATKDTKISSLYQRQVPNIIYYDQDNIPYIQENAENASYSYFQLGGPLIDVYNISSQGRSAIDILQDQLYKFIYCTQNITITTLPIYTLQPNYRIIVNSHDKGLSGEYIITKYSVPLVYNGTMSITAVKAIPYIGING